MRFSIRACFGGMAIRRSRGMMANRQIRIAQRKAAKIVAEASLEAKDALQETRREVDKVKSIGDTEYRERRTELQRQENRLTQKEATLEHKLEGAEQRERNLAGKEKKIDSVRVDLEEVKEKQLKQLELISDMSSGEAKQILFEKIEIEMQAESARRLREWETKVKDEADEKARDILSQVIQRNASEVVPETTARV